MSQKDYNMEIIGILLKSKSHIRELARLLHTNQTTIARKVGELSKLNILDFNQEGKNKVFFIKKTLEARQYVQSFESYNLIKLLRTYPKLRRIIELIKNNPRINLAILFGSYAKSLAKTESDIDIYLDTLDKSLKQEVELIDFRISVKIGKYNKDSPLIKEIEKDHIILRGIEIYYGKNKFFN